MPVKKVSKKNGDFLTLFRYLFRSRGIRKKAEDLQKKGFREVPKYSTYRVLAFRKMVRCERE